MWFSCELELAMPAVHKQNTLPCPQFLNLALFLQTFMTPMRASGKNRETSPPIGPQVPETSSRNHQSPAARSKKKKQEHVYDGNTPHSFAGEHQSCQGWVEQ